MRLLFVHDHIFYKTIEDEIYSGAAYPTYAWNRYLEFFCEINVVGRYGGLCDKKENGLILSSREHVYFHFVDSITSISKMIRNTKKVNNYIKELLKNSDALVVRLPSENGSIAIECAKELDKPYAIEVVGCIWDALWNHGSIAAKLYAPYAYFRMKRNIKKSNMNLYVTEKFLQKRYPSKYSSLCINASNVEVKLNKKCKTKLFNNKKIVIGLIGNYKTKYKGLHTAITAIGKIENKLDDFEFRILGKGNPEDYQKLIKKNNLKKKIIFSGSLPNGEPVMKWLDEVDIYIQPSLQEGLPRALIEAMSRGCICIGSDAGGIPELLPKRFIHKAGSANDLSNVITDILDKKNNWPQISLENQENAKKYDAFLLQKARRKFYSKLAKEAKKI